MKEMKKKRIAHPWGRSKAGFTLVELIVVIAVLGILSGVGVVGYSGYIKQAHKAHDIQMVGDVKYALELGKVANTIQGSASVVLHQNGEPTCNGTGTEEALKAAFGNDLAGLTLQYDSWDSSAFNGANLAEVQAVSQAIKDSSFSGNPEGITGLMKGVDAVVDIVAKDSGYFNNGHIDMNAFEQWQDEHGIRLDRTDPDYERKLANATVAYVADQTTTGGITADQLHQKISEGAAADNPFLGIYQKLTTEVYGNPKNDFASAATLYAVIEAYCTQAPYGSEKALETLHNTENVSNMGELAQNIANAVGWTVPEDERNNWQENAMAKVQTYMGTPQFKKDLDGYLAALKAMNTNAESTGVLDRLGEKDLFSSSSCVGMVEGYLEMGATNSDGSAKVQIGNNEVAVVMSDSGNTATIPYDALK